MDDFALQVHVREVMTQCSFALNAVRALDNVLPRASEAGERGDFELAHTLHEEVFRTLHSMLTHSSNVSRLLWPAKPRRKNGEDASAYEARCAVLPRLRRAAELRSAMELPLDGHVLKSRRLRDHLEHFDERLDDWQATSERHNIVQDTIGPKGSIAGIDVTDMMRWYDPEAKAFRFRGEEYDLQALVGGVEDVYERARAYLEAKRRWLEL